MQEYKIYPPQLSKQKVKILDLMEQDLTLGICSSPDAITNIQFLETFLIRKCIQGEQSLLIIPKESHEFFRNYFNKSLLKNLIGYHDSLGFHFIQKPGKPRTDPADLEEALRTQIEYNHAIQQLHKRLNRNSIREENDFSYLKIIELVYLSSKDPRITDLSLRIDPSGFEFNKSEFWRLRGRIEKASKNYKSSYRIIKATDVFKDDIYYNFHKTENRTEILTSLNKFRKKSKDLSRAYEKEFSRIALNLERSYIDEIKKIASLCQKVRLQIQLNQLEEELHHGRSRKKRKKDNQQGKQVFRAQYNLLTDELEASKLIQSQYPINSWKPDYAKVQNFLDELQLLIEKLSKELQGHVLNQLQVVNQGNSPETSLRKLDKDFEEICFSIDDSKFFKSSVLKLGLSSWKNHLYLKKLESELTAKIQFLSEHLDYCIWRSFETSSSENLNLILSVLEEIPPYQWLSHFEKWYFNAVLRNRFPSHFGYALETKEELLNLHFKNIQYTDLRLNQAQEYKFEKLSKQNKTHWEKLKKSISEFGENKAFNPDQIKDHLEVIQRIIPVFITTEPNITSRLNLKFKNIVFWDKNTSSMDSSIINEANNLLLFKSKPIKDTELSHLYGIKRFKHHEHFNIHTYYIPPIEKENRSLKSKLVFGRALSSILAQSPYHKLFFSAKKFSIISVLNPFYSKLLEDELRSVSVKKLKYHHIEDGIVEDILMKEEDDKYFLVQDDFWLNGENPIYQLEILYLLKQAGLKVISVQSMSILHLKSDYLHTLFQIPINTVKKDPSPIASNEERN